MVGIETTRRIRQLEAETGRPPILIVGYTASVAGG
jgi:CheY-like chemotaxis protein